MATPVQAEPTAQETVTIQLLRTPRAAAFAGIAFSLLFIVSISLMRLAVPENPAEDTFAWVEESRRSVKFALTLVPFVGIAFLWFLGVLRDRLGEHEDKFFSTVFFGSGLLFMAMIFVSAALAAGILATFEAHPELVNSSDAITYGRAVIYTVMNVYAIRMAGVFMLSLSTIWLRTQIMPRLIGLATFVLANIMLWVINLSLWIVMVFPLWVLAVSIYILAQSLRDVDTTNLLKWVPRSRSAKNSPSQLT
ncbi:MAG: hypothetical protein ACRC1H_09710 [Caldilineaceae bacterium]